MAPRPPLQQVHPLSNVNTTPRQPIIGATMRRSSARAVRHPARRLPHQLMTPLGVHHLQPVGRHVSLDNLHLHQVCNFDDRKHLSTPRIPWKFEQDRTCGFDLFLRELHTSVQMFTTNFHDRLDLLISTCDAPSHWRLLPNCPRASRRVLNCSGVNLFNFPCFHFRFFHFFHFHQFVNVFHFSFVFCFVPLRKFDFWSSLFCISPFHSCFPRSLFFEETNVFLLYFLFQLQIIASISIRV